MLKTLAAKHQSTVSKMAAKHQAKIETRYGLRTCFEARVHRDGKPDWSHGSAGYPWHATRTRSCTTVSRNRSPTPARS